MAKDENGIASILSHEIAHVIARHSAEQITWHSILRGLQFMTAFVYDIPYVFSSAILVYGFLFPFSRSCESEADYIGLLLMANGITSYNSACYDPRGATMLWKRMLKQQKGKEPFEYLSTHPNHEKRIDKIEEWMSEALNKYEEARCQNVLFLLLNLRLENNWKIFLKRLFECNAFICNINYFTTMSENRVLL